ncbi:uncharacterized protein LOC121376544 isoform X2 [Gigantopelta aegis]|uniref:uncharacterized protein LOC121376544 isoform X2 n=1 Tax=Gigantopelta aegis TaxID=1735272 RepID=UPI001B8887E9|nr:uncharacterized protein LOC121376544 isoform X2 [Gigantopelta aegis]XP_041360388.1 uncharacterized protein LOC121376544 isoform X2 [Gigantopelta aegis]
MDSREKGENMTPCKCAAGCIDYSGVNRSHSDSWSSAAGQCDKNICYFSQSVGIWIIEERCRQIYSWENPDPDNCQKVSNLNVAFPACCEVLQCDSSTPLTTQPPSYCYDKGSAVSCWFWNSVPDPCLPVGKYYNFTKEYCKKTCGFC